MRGLPVIRDTRVTVASVLGQLAARRTVDGILEDYPYLETEDIYQVLAFAAAAMQEREMSVIEPGLAVTLVPLRLRSCRPQKSQPARWSRRTRQGGSR